MTTNLSLPAFGWSPRAYQMPAWRALTQPDVRTVSLAWHRRSGKDELALHHAACKAMQRVGNYWHMLPMRDQARRALWEAVNPKTGRERWRDAFPDEIIAHRDNQSMMLTLRNGSTWQVLGSDNYDSMVGATPVGMTFSEAALADPNAYSFFRPILLENKGWSVHVSTPRGMNHYHRLHHSLDGQEGTFAQVLRATDTDVFTPEDLEAERRAYIAERGGTIGKMLFEQEYMCSWDAANVGAVFATELAEMVEQGRTVPLQYDPRYPVDTSWDIGILDPTVVLFWQTVGNTVRLIDWYSANTTGVDHYASVLSNKPYFYGRHIGPHDIVNRGGGNASSWYTTGRALGLHFERMPNTPMADSIAAGANLLRRAEINVRERVEMPEDDCAYILAALKHYHFSYDKERNTVSRQPIHDWSSHYASAMMTYGLHLAQNPKAHRPQGLQGNGQTLDDKHFSSMRIGDILRGQRQPRGAFE